MCSCLGLEANGSACKSTEPKRDAVALKELEPFFDDHVAEIFTAMMRLASVPIDSSQGMRREMMASLYGAAS